MRFKNIILGIGIFIVFMFLLHNGIRAFYDKPQYSDLESCVAGGYGEFGYRPYAYPDKIGVDNCTVGKDIRDEEQRCAIAGGEVIYDYNDNGCISGVKECNYCTKEYNEAMKKYNKNVFIIAIIVGIIVLLVGYLVLSVEPVGSALMASGIGAIVYGTIANWENLGNIGRFLLLLLALILLIWIALRINKESKKSKWMFWKK